MNGRPATIVNADDFGHRAETNAAIVECFRNGWISSATVMANMPGFEEACQMVADHRLRKHVGLHFVLTEGRPLTDAIRRQPRFCNADGDLIATRKRRFLFLSREETQAIAAEIRGQIERCRSHGLQLTHLDSHHHIHEEFGILSAVLPVLREYGIPFVRIMNNLSTNISRLRRMYTASCNAFLRHRRLRRTCYFGDITQASRLATLRPGQPAGRPAAPDAELAELMVHPVMSEGQVCDKLSGRRVADLLCSTALPGPRVSFSGDVYDG